MRCLKLQPSFRQTDVQGCYDIPQFIYGRAKWFLSDDHENLITSQEIWTYESSTEYKNIF
jgi:hypothetical protein